MQNRLVFVSIVIAGAFAADLAVAQSQVESQAKQEIQKTDPLPPMTDGSKSDQGGKAEPSSKVPTSDDQSVLLNGALTAKGSPKDVDTVPSKFSERTAADDKLPIVGYRLKQLSADQRREIAESLRAPASGTASAPESADSYASIGMELPGAVAMRSLTPMPTALAAKYPELGGTAYMRSGGKMVIVDLDNNLVVGVLES